MTEDLKQLQQMAEKQFAQLKTVHLEILQVLIAKEIAKRKGK